MFPNISLEESLQILDLVDRGELRPEHDIRWGSHIAFKGNRIDEMRVAGAMPGVALDGRKGGVLVRRGHATSKRFVMNAHEALNFYWATDAGREAARKLSPAA